MIFPGHTGRTYDAMKDNMTHTPSSGADRPRFAIVSAVYNVSRFLDAYMTSIERQTFDQSQLEVIVVDDGSTDDCLEVLHAWQARHPDMVKVLTKENGGQASARNVGLKHTTAEWVTFLDPDDWVNDEYFQTVHDFLEEHDPDIDMIGTNRVLFEEAHDRIRDGHPLRRMFTSDQVVGLHRFPKYFQGSAPASFVKLERVHALGLEFDERVWPNFEDGHFCARYLLDIPEPKIGFLKSAIYYYRKRADNSSTLGSSVQQFGRFTDVPRYGYLDVLRKGAEQYGRPPEWLQNFILYELSWYFSEEDKPSGSASAATGEVGAKFIDLLGQIAPYFDDAVVRSFDIRKYKQIWRDILRYGATGQDWHTNYAVLQAFDHSRKEVKIAYRFTGNAPQEAFYDKGLPVTPLHEKVRTYPFFDSPILKERAVWLPISGTMRVKLNGQLIELRTSWVDDFLKVATHRTILADKFRLTGVPPRKRLLAPLKQWVRKQQATFTVANFKKKRSDLKVDVARRLARSRFFRPQFKNAWVLMDRIHDANDSAETLFHHLRKDHPEINAWFVLEEGTLDWKRLEAIGCDHLIAHGSLKWRLLMLNCDKLISSHMDVPICRPPQIMRLRNASWDFICLQHGVIKDDLSRWLNTKKIALFVTSTHAEYNSIAGPQSPYAMTSKEVALTGLPRFDALQAAADKIAGQPKDLVIFAPTWRHWLLDPLKAGSQRRQLSGGFDESEFAQSWGEVLGSSEWKNAPWMKNHKLAILPHPNLVGVLDQLHIGDDVQVLDYANPDLHSYFARAAVLVTDFSSMAFNAAYLERPVVYFQFDRQRVLSGGHVGRAGYFDYHRDGFGPVVETATDTIAAVARTITNGGALAPFDQRIKDTFVYRDGQCSERVVTAIQAL